MTKTTHSLFPFQVYTKNSLCKIQITRLTDWKKNSDIYTTTAVGQEECGYILDSMARSRCVSVTNIWKSNFLNYEKGNLKIQPKRKTIQWRANVKFKLTEIKPDNLFASKFILKFPTPPVQEKKDFWQRQQWTVSDSTFLGKEKKKEKKKITVRLFFF